MSISVSATREHQITAKEPFIKLLRRLASGLNRLNEEHKSDIARLTKGVNKVAEAVEALHEKHELPKPDLKIAKPESQNGQKSIGSQVLDKIVHDANRFLKQGLNVIPGLKLVSAPKSAEAIAEKIDEFNSQSEEVDFIAYLKSHIADDEVSSYLVRDDSFPEILETLVANAPASLNLTEETTQKIVKNIFTLMTDLQLSDEFFNTDIADPEIQEMLRDFSRIYALIGTDTQGLEDNKTYQNLKNDFHSYAGIAVLMSFVSSYMYATMNKISVPEALKRNFIYLNDFNMQELDENDVVSSGDKTFNQTVSKAVSYIREFLNSDSEQDWADYDFKDTDALQMITTSPADILHNISDSNLKGVNLAGEALFHPEDDAVAKGDYETQYVQLLEEALTLYSLKKPEPGKARELFDWLHNGHNVREITDIKLDLGLTEDSSSPRYNKAIESLQKNLDKALTVGIDTALKRDGDLITGTDFQLLKRIDKFSP